MKLKVSYEIDGEQSFFYIEDESFVECHEELGREIERLGLDGVKNNVLIDIELNNKRSASFLMIPCWYFVNTNEVVGRSTFYGILLEIADGVTSMISGLSERITGRTIEFKVKVKQFG